MGVLPTKGLTLPLMSYGRSSMIVTLAWVGLLLRVYHEAMQNTRGMATCALATDDAREPRSRERRHEHARPSSSWPAAPAATCSRRWRSRACCAPRRTKSSGSARKRGLEARVVPAENIPDRMAVHERPARQGRATLLAAPFKLAHAHLAGARRHAPAPSRGSWSASAASSPGRAAWRRGSRAGRSLIHEQNAIAGYSNRCLAHLARRVLAAFPKAFPAGRRRAGGRQSGARGNRRCRRRPPSASRAAKARCACSSSAAAWARRASTPWCRSPSRASRGLTLHVRHQAGERGIDAARAAYARGGA